MSVWYCVPSARPSEEAEKCLSKWRKQGYRVAIQRDPGKNAPMPGVVGYARPYAGYAEAVNFLAREVLLMEPSCDWVVTGGDDTEPDLNHTADEIAAQCSEHFLGRMKDIYPPYRPEWARRIADYPASPGNVAALATFGVMQPTGDRFAYSKHQGSAPIDRVAGSPWMGREWCLRINQGRGPMWSGVPGSDDPLMQGYTHMFSDEELQNVAIKYGVFWQRPDLIHLHHHFQRESPAIDSKAIAAPTPPHLIEANSPAHWEKYKKIFEDRKRAGFPGSEPL